MAKRELSSTLKNLKFMQRAAQKEEKPKKEEEEVRPDGNFIPPNTHNRKCAFNLHGAVIRLRYTSIVIMEGNPQPGAFKGRMSFQSFNPSIDKLNEEAANSGQPLSSATNSGDQFRTSDRENDSPQVKLEGSSASKPDSDSDGDHKRKQSEIETESEYPNESKRNVNGEVDLQSSPSNSKSSKKQRKREKLDWSVLRPPKAENRRG